MVQLRVARRASLWLVAPRGMAINAHAGDL
jgi:hypothetical protein